MSDFFCLPFEIRTIIYGYCLIVDYTIAPYPSTYELSNLALRDRQVKRRLRTPVSKPELPAVGILQVSKQMHKESCPILYGQNRWKHPQCWSNSECYESMFDLHEALFKDIEMCFDWREGSFSSNHMTTDESRRGVGLFYSRFQGLNHDERLEYVHNTSNSYMFSRSIEELSHLFPRLNSLVIDVTHLYCTLGCCREDLFCVEFMADFIQRLVKEILRSEIQIVKFVGLKNDLERDHVYEQWGFDRSGVVDRVAMAERWKGGFVPATNGDDVANEGGLIFMDRNRCAVCSGISVSDELSNPVLPRNCLVVNANP
ncbi:MAG: hypothetical protein HETSPECPRED_009277 [Heterodermia speciosa]|uniref:Uncharacterized protein n=1 Tax=Heterodermia speciosa TaxID=116794 RepID=A0A8H3G4E4_9LECA|nr:MAG: hypothetical protein HETSPECPRED_009277 [Heterodermia speciosa]